MFVGAPHNKDHYLFDFSFSCLVWRIRRKFNEQVAISFSTMPKGVYDRHWNKFGINPLLPARRDRSRHFEFSVPKAWIMDYFTMNYLEHFFFGLNKALDIDPQCEWTFREGKLYFVLHYTNERSRRKIEAEFLEAKQKTRQWIREGKPPLPVI